MSPTSKGTEPAVHVSHPRHTKPSNSKYVGCVTAHGGGRQGITGHSSCRVCGSKSIDSYTSHRHAHATHNYPHPHTHNTHVHTSPPRTHHTTIHMHSTHTHI